MILQKEAKYCKVNLVLNYISPLSESCSVVKQHFILFHNQSVCTFSPLFYILIW